MRIALVGLLCLPAIAPIGAEEPLPGNAPMKLLSCAYGSIPVQPIPAPPGFENQFAVAVVEVTSSRYVRSKSAPEVALLFTGGSSLGTKRVVSVDVLDGPYVSGEGNMFMSSPDARRMHEWDGTLPVGTTRLRVQVALATQSFPQDPKTCRVVVGPYEVEGPIDFSWPT